MSNNDIAVKLKSFHNTKDHDLLIGKEMMLQNHDLSNGFDGS